MHLVRDRLDPAPEVLAAGGGDRHVRRSTGLTQCVGEPVDLGLRRLPAGEEAEVDDDEPVRTVECDREVTVRLSEVARKTRDLRYRCGVSSLGMRPDVVPLRTTYRVTRSSNAGWRTAMWMCGGRKPAEAGTGPWKLKRPWRSVTTLARPRGR